MPGDPYILGAILGELYEISNSILIYLDLLEGHPEVYGRERISIGYSLSDKWISTDAWMYLYAGKPTNNSDHIIRTRDDDVILYKWKGE